MLFTTVCMSPHVVVASGSVCAAVGEPEGAALLLCIIHTISIARLPAVTACFAWASCGPGASTLQHDDQGCGRLFQVEHPGAGPGCVGAPAGARPQQMRLAAAPCRWGRYVRDSEAGVVSWTHASALGVMQRPYVGAENNCAGDSRLPFSACAQGRLRQP